MGSSQSTGAPQGNHGNVQHDAGETSVGHRTSCESGATRTRETMAETGGSGGAGLTGNQVGAPRQGAGKESDASTAPGSGSAQAKGGAMPDRQTRRAAPGSAIESGARGFQDTRSEQAGGSDTGLGTPETGANQVPADLDRQGRGQRK